MINIKQWEEICLSSLSNSYLGQKWAIWAGQAADWNRLLIFLYSLLNLHLILFNHAKLSSFIDGLQHFEDNFNAFSFENFRVRWHTIIYDFFALLNTQPKDFCLLTISRCCLKKRGRKVAPNQTSCQKLTGSALLCLAGVEWVLGQIRRWMADISNANFQGLWCQSSTQKWAYTNLMVGTSGYV